MMRAVFVDRDGIINKDHGYVYKIDDFHFIDGVFESFKYLNSKGFNLIIITNQSGIGRGYYKERDFRRITDWMLDKFKKKGVAILDVFYCPHTKKDNCTCRKPKTGMFENANAKYRIDKDKSWMIGDKESDIAAAHAFGVTNTILVKNGNKTEKKNNTAKFLVPSIKEIRHYIL